MQHALAKHLFAKIAATLVAAFSLVSAQIMPDSVVQTLDTPAVAAPDSSLDLLSSLQEVPDSVVSKSALKSVLYLGGGEHSPWFHLGVLYAIESYSIPVDSVVGNSWGAFVGFLWAKGEPLDDIQRILLDPYVAKYVGHNEFDDLYKNKERSFDVPVSVDGMPSLRHRFVVASDSNGRLRRDVKTLEPDSSYIQRQLAKLRLQESLNREPASFVIPFKMMDCNGGLHDSADDVFKSLPLVENYYSGEHCPYNSKPFEEDTTELSFISVAAPMTVVATNASWNSPWQYALANRELQNMSSQPGVVIRAHTVLDTSRSAWIQAGFSAMERRLGEAARLFPRKVNYASRKKSAKPWFRFNPVFDSLSAECQSVTKTYWNPQDTGMFAPENFAYALMSRPAFDSVAFKMLPTGDLWVNASVKPTFDVFAGGFGSNAIGPNVYGGASMNYVDQMDINLVVSGFWGNETYGFTPRLTISRLWNKNWSFALGYDWMQLKPLKSYINETEDYWRIYSEERSDLEMSVDYQFTSSQKVSLKFLFGDHTYGLSPDIYSRTSINTYPVMPSVRYEFLSGSKDPWFATEGLSLSGEVGLQSIGLDLDLYDGIPIYWRTSFEARYAHSPAKFFTFGVAAAGGLDVYHDAGHGYVYPESFEFMVLDNTFRQRIRSTPWSTEWYDGDSESHHYGLLRLNVGLHRGPIGAWVFGAYFRDFEKNPSALLGQNKFALEPALRFAYKSIAVYAGLSRTVDNESFGDLKKFGDYRYFIRVGDYEF